MSYTFLYLLLGTYIYYFTMRKYVVQLVYLLILAIITWHWNSAYYIRPWRFFWGESRAQLFFSIGRSWALLERETPLWYQGKDHLWIRRFVSCLLAGLLSYLRYLWLHSGVQHICCCVLLCFLRLVYLMLPVSLDCPPLSAPSVFSNVYLEGATVCY